MEVSSATGTKRTANFTHGEENLLVCLAKRYKHILENKKTDTNANREKGKCWEQIEKQFTSESGLIYRSAQVLKKKYENIKKATKKKVADEKCSRFKTGGGPNTEIKFTEIDENVMEMLGDVRVEGFPARYGGDRDVETIQFIIEECEDEPKDVSGCSMLNDELHAMDISVDTSVRDDTSSKLSWKKHSGQMLKAPQAKELTKPDRDKENIGSRYEKQQRRVTNKVTQWAEQKAEVEMKKRELLNEEHSIKLKYMKEKHDIEIEILQAESKARMLKLEQEMKVLEEEQELKREILHLEKLELLKKLKNKSN